MSERGPVQREFDPPVNALSKGKRRQDGLSAVVQVGDTLWVTNDETVSLERLSFQPEHAAGDLRYSDQEQFALNDYLRPPVPPPSDPQKKIKEADVEGLD